MVLVASVLVVGGLAFVGGYWSGVKRRRVRYPWMVAIDEEVARRIRARRRALLDASPGRARRKLD